MVDFLKKRLQVFVSSTFSDLKVERQAAVEAILSSGHIPAGMELFTAGDESQMEVIKQWIDESDVYLLILAGRYGSVEPKTSKSYTHLEYEYAVAQCKPLFACVITEQSLEQRVKSMGTLAIERDHPQHLKDFRSTVLTRMVRFWDDFKDIKIAIGDTLSQFARRQDLVGWVRPSATANMPALVDEITRLSKENAELRAEQIKQPANLSAGEISFQDMKRILKNKDLLEYFEAQSPVMSAGDFDNPLNQSERERVQDLSVLGLVRPFGAGFRLSERGRVFLNSLEVERLHEERSQTRKSTKRSSRQRKS